MSKDKSSILWIDLEMTGLDPNVDRIVELAAIATDWDFNETASLEVVVAQDPDLLENMVEEVKKMHTKSGLLPKIKDGVTEKEAENQLVDFIEQNFTDSPVLLAGNSIHQDRRFIRKYWPKAEDLLHYRQLDVSSWKVVFANKFGVKFNKQNSHRALDDIRASIEELKTYLQRVK